MFRKYKKHKDKKIYIENNDPSPPLPSTSKKCYFGATLQLLLAEMIYLVIIFLETAPKKITPPLHKNLTLYKRN